MSNVQTNQQVDPDAFLMGSSVPSAKFPKIGASITGVICEEPTLQQQRDMATKELKTWPDGNPMWQLVVTLQTDEHDSNIEDDDGRRRVYLKSHMKESVAAAVRVAGAKKLEIGGQLTVKYAKDGKPTQKGFSAPKYYEATYVPPTESFLESREPEEETTGSPEIATNDQVKSWTFAEAVAYAKGFNVSEDEIKAELKACKMTKWDEQARRRVFDMCIPW